MKVIQKVLPEYGYHEDFSFLITVTNDDGTPYRGEWRSESRFGSKVYKSVPSKVGRNAIFYGSPAGRGTIETTIETEDGEKGEDVRDVYIVRTRVVVTSKPSKARILLGWAGHTTTDTYLLTSETLEMGVFDYEEMKVTLRRTGYRESVRQVKVIKDSKTELYVILKKE